MTHLAPQRTFALVFCLSLLGRLDGLEAIEGASAGKQGFRSPVLSRGFVSIDVDVRGAKRLYLVVDDGGDGIGCDWADWAEPRLEGARGTRRLTDLRWKSASAGWGSVRMGRNAGGGPLRIAGKTVEYGIGTHSPSVIEFELPEGYARFKARGGLDNGGTDQGCGSTVSFQVFVDQLPARVTRALRRRGGAGPLDAEESLQELDVHEGLEVTLFAHEPMLVNPTNLDIDARGRVWVTEGVNYRRWKNNQPEGDRIVILEDTDLDGRADRRKVFYQDPSINSALGICALGKRVIVSCSPNVFVFTDEDGDDRPDSKEVLFSGIGGLQHDHGVHAFVFGPDGKLYFNFGNSGGRLLDGQGKPIVDGAGNIVEARGQPYRQGMVFRCNLDGSGVETLGHNFRNNYEVAVDSFGTLWQSDNDDDGHRGVRINYVMEFGNFGYQDERSGAGWASPRTGMHEEIPRRHWHLNDPGVVPNLLQTGAGSPTGICVYEGRLLPKPFHDQVIHCDAGPNVVRSYPVTRRGAGYTAEILDLVKGRDRWFRPSDVCVAADGSVFIADWYDAGVGGHNMADNQVANTRGRIFRVAPHGHRRVVPPLELSTAAGAVRALQSPNHSRRYLAWRALQALGEGAENELLDLWENGDTRTRSRALHLLARIPGRETHYVERAVRDAHPEIRVTALRIARERGLDVISHVERLVHDLSPHVRRECAIALRHHDSPEAPRLWTELALQHHAGDRWYLEALGIGAQRQEDAFFAAWLERVGTGWRSPAGRDVVWRSRSPRSSALLARLVRDPETPDTERARYFRAFDSLEGDEKEEALVSLLAVEDPFVAGETLR
ncbi:MAG: NPCBM/NEW2 domain-containing protein, partial [Planctomycetota bacterium]|nr:NPCBM/NEW2 domain-containing protein [Planctomycetota bacterium]